MGCASSQASVVSATNDNTTTEQKVLSSSSTDEAENDKPGNEISPTEPVKYPPAESFVIPLDDGDNNDEQNKKPDSIIKKHPPKRLLRLTEQTNMPTTIEDLEQKLVKAELRRQKFLQQRVEGAINSIPTRIIGDDNEYGDKCGSGDGDDDDDENRNDSDDMKVKNLKDSKNIELKMNTEENFQNT